MYGLQEHEMRFYCLFKKVYFSLLATSDFFCRHAYAYAHMRIIRHESDMAAYAWPSLVSIMHLLVVLGSSLRHCEFSSKKTVGVSVVQELFMVLICNLARPQSAHLLWAG